MIVNPRTRRTHFRPRPQSLALHAWALGTLLALPSLGHAESLNEAFTPMAAYTGETAWLVDGGKDIGAAYAGQWFVGGDLDLEQLSQWSGAKIKLRLSSRHGDNLAVDEIGNSTSVQEIYGGQGERLANLTLEQTLLDGKLLLEGGRTVANIHFLGSELCNYFQLNAACGNPTFVFRTSNFTYWPVSSWGAHAQAWLTPQVYVHVGAYEVNPTQARDGEHGLDWSIDDDTGVVAPWAVGFKRSSRPGYYELGGWYDTSDYSDPLLDENHQPAAETGQPYAPLNGRSGLFLRFEQQLTQAVAGSNRGLTVFGAWLTGTSGELTSDQHFQAGFVQRGTFAGRPDDSLAAVYTLQDYSDKALDNVALIRAQNGGSGRPPGSQSMIELSYGIALSKSLRVQPNLIYIINPDQFAEPSRTQDLDDALVLGLRVDWNMGAGLEALLGKR